jgi:hypothetical protein
MTTSEAHSTSMMVIVPPPTTSVTTVDASIGTSCDLVHHTADELYGFHILESTIADSTKLLDERWISSPYQIESLPSMSLGRYVASGCVSCHCYPPRLWYIVSSVRIGRGE